MKIIKNFWETLKRSGSEFLQDNGLKLSSSLSYYTIFSIGPLLILIISLAGIFWGRDAVQGKIYGQINGLVGNGAAKEIQDIIQNIEKAQLGTSGAILGLIVLFIGATGVFTEMQDSINYIWSVKAKPKRGFVKLIMNRLISFSLILVLGFLLTVSLILNALTDLLHDRLAQYLSNSSIYIFHSIDFLVVITIITSLFATIYKILPDVNIEWKDAFIGAAFTSALFIIGKFLISLYVSNSNVATTYGAAGSIIILMLWIYYTSIILFFGAEFTKIYSINYGAGVKPNDTAVFIIKSEVKELPANDRIMPSLPQQVK